MADAAYAIITQDSRACTGNFFVDEHLLRQQGVTDFEKYSVVPGTTDFMLDFFLDENLSQLKTQESPMGKEKSQTNTSETSNVAQIFDRIKSLFTPELLKKLIVFIHLIYKEINGI